jgi:hypothetical protein
MMRALDSAIGFPSRPTSASSMLGLLMPEEVRRSFMRPPGWLLQARERSTRLGSVSGRDWQTTENSSAPTRSSLTASGVIRGGSSRRWTPAHRGRAERRLKSIAAHVSQPAGRPSVRPAPGANELRLNWPSRSYKVAKVKGPTQGEFDSGRAAPREAPYHLPCYQTEGTSANLAARELA